MGFAVAHFVHLFSITDDDGCTVHSDVIRLCNACGIVTTFLSLLCCTQYIVTFRTVWKNQRCVVQYTLLHALESRGLKVQNDTIHISFCVF